MQVLIAPDKFKGSLTAVEVGQAIERGLLEYDGTLRMQTIPLADGGEGSLEVIAPHLGLKSVTVQVHNPLGRPIEASYMISTEAAYIEMSAASGLELLTEPERNCLFTSSQGTGELILDAYYRGFRQIFLFVGGSATSDGGIGILNALGIIAIGKIGALLPIGKSLPEIVSFNQNNRIEGIEVTVICDVQNPLYGAQGAAQVYAPQKGATPEAVMLLDRGLRNLAGVVKNMQNIDVSSFPGAGAAGGVAAGLKGFYPTKVVSGFSAIQEIAGLEAAINDADLVITGEGKLDSQTLQGKVVKGVYDLCVAAGKPLAVICGILDLDPAELQSLNVWKIESLVNSATNQEQAKADAFNLVRQRAFHLLQ